MESNRTPFDQLNPAAVVAYLKQSTDLTVPTSTIEAALAATISSEVGLLVEAGRHIIGAGGKRLRPALTILAYRLAGGEDLTRVVPLATAVELIHTASLIHDDINDHSDLRRGQATVNARWGDAAALLTGDFIFVKVMQLIGTFEPALIRVLANACVSIVEGETRQMLTLGDLDMTEETYLKIVSQKTASLFAAAAEGGALLAGVDARRAAALATYGHNLGIAFQMRDDALDFLGEPDELGKPVKLDIEQGKMSLPIIEALDRDGAVREALQAKDFARAFRLIRETGAFEVALQRAEDHAQGATGALRTFPRCEARHQLEALAAYAVTRTK